MGLLSLPLLLLSLVVFVTGAGCCLVGAGVTPAPNVIVDAVAAACTDYEPYSLVK